MDETDSADSGHLHLDKMEKEPHRIPFLQDNIYSNSRLGAGGGLEEEMQHLVEEQKLCRARARKLSLETNRRRKALEERRRQWDMQEQQRKQQALEQRRQRLQDATERFQKSHLPASQRYKRNFRMNTPNIEDALKEIQAELSSCSQKSSFLPKNSNISRSWASSSKLPVSQSCHCHAASQPHSKLLQEQKKTCFRNKQQTDNRTTKQKQQDHLSQNLSDLCISENNSGKDGLENENSNHSTRNLQFSNLSFPLDSEKPHTDLGVQVCEEVQKTAVSVTTSQSAHEAILSKPPKYISGDATCEDGSGNWIFGKQVALVIRDSVELTKAKTKEPGGKNTIKKKLRWFDEGQVGKDEKNSDIIKPLNTSSPCQTSKKSEDHQQSHTTVSRGFRPAPNLTLPASTGYHSIKQAWADVGVQVNLPHEQAEEVKVQWNSATPSGLKVPCTEFSSSRTRRGTVIRPQSSTKMSQIANSQGKIIVPRPPPRMELVEERTASVTKTSHRIVHPSVLYTPQPPSYTCPISESHIKATPNQGLQELQGCSRRSGTLYDEKGLALDYTPTDEEISHLWQHVRSALTTKEVTTKPRGQTIQSGQVVKSSMEQSRQVPGSSNRSFPQPSQPTKQTTKPSMPPPSVYDVTFPDEGLMAAQLRRARMHAKGLKDEQCSATAMKTGLTHMIGKVQQNGELQGLTTISMEEQKIFLSIERLNRQLLCVQERLGNNSRLSGLIHNIMPFTREVKATNRAMHPQLTTKHS